MAPAETRHDELISFMVAARHRGRFEALFPLHAQINLRVFIDVDDHLVYQDSSLFLLQLFLSVSSSSSIF